MTNEEAFFILENKLNTYYFTDEDIEALNKAIEVLKKEPCYKITCCSDCEVYDREKHTCPRFCEVIKETVKEIKEEKKTH